MQTKKYKIELKDIRLYAYHGVMEQERNIGAWFTMDIRLTINDHSCTESDNIYDTISYADVYDTIKEEMGKPSNLLENVSRRIMETLFNRFPSIEEVETTLCKETPPMGGDGLKACVILTAAR